MYSHVTLFELPHLLDLICSHLSTNDLIPCTQVSSLWNHLFRQQLLRHIRFADLKKETTWDILDHAHRIRSLQIDIADGGWFLLGSNPTIISTTTEAAGMEVATAGPCINLEELHCVDFGYFRNPSGPDDDWYDEYFPYTAPASFFLMNRAQPHPSAGTSTNALGLVQQNPRLRVLKIEHGLPNYGVDHFTPQVLQSLSEHPALVRLDIQLNFDLTMDFLVVLLRHLPTRLQELYLCVHEFVDDVLGTNTHLHPQPSTLSTLLAATTSTTCLKKICLRTDSSGPESIWHVEDARNSWEYYHQSCSYPERLVLPLLKRSPRLQELILGGYAGRPQTLVPTLLESCPELEVLDFGGSDPNNENEDSYTDELGQPLPEGMLSRLRTFRLRGHCESWSTRDQFAMAEMVMARSAATLEVLWLEASNFNRGWALLNPFCLRRGRAEDELRRVEYPRLEELVIRTGKDWVYPDAVTPYNADDDDRGVCGSGLGYPYFHINFPVLERLSLFISDAALNDCHGCDGSLGRGRKNQVQRQESHQRQFVSRLQQLFSSLRSCSSLKKLAFHWQLCATIQEMTQEDLLERVNGDNYQDDHIQHPPLPLMQGLARITAEDLNWIDLLLPTRAQVAKRKAFKANARQQKAWEEEVGEKLQGGLSVTRYSDPLDPLYRRVGRGWQDWESLLGRCGCRFPQLSGWLSAGWSRRQRPCADNDYFEWMACPHDAGVGSKLEDLLQLC
ncbi:hypothetical protein BGW39_010387 [Mortierella sp. 14UC]|nr:hypothetical protein BGW39_010387 [Mortierella sp. 14UC]